MAYWLYVDGPGSWSFNKFYRGGTGPYEVDEETYERAVAAEREDVWVWVADERPEVPRRKPLSGTLTSLDVRVGTEDTEARQRYDAEQAALAAQVTEAKVQKETPTGAVKAERTPCPVGCGRDYANLEALQRHIEKNHPETVAA